METMHQPVHTHQVLWTVWKRFDMPLYRVITETGFDNCRIKFLHQQVFLMLRLKLLSCHSQARSDWRPRSIFVSIGSLRQAWKDQPTKSFPFMTHDYATTSQNFCSIPKQWEHQKSFSPYSVLDLDTEMLECSKLYYEDLLWQQNALEMGLQHPFILVDTNRWQFWQTIRRASTHTWEKPWWTVLEQVNLTWSHDWIYLERCASKMNQWFMVNPSQITCLGWEKHRP